MITLNLIMAVLGLLIVLVVLIFLIVKPNEEITKTITTKLSIQEPVKETKTKEFDFESLRKIIKNKRSNAKQLEEALELIIKYHGNIHPRLGVRAHPDFDRYMDVLFTICRHKNATSKMIVKFDKELAALNPDYVKEINDAIARGLNSRGV
jgi:Na+-transporting methylmalonyl-CoA/oxaloacetate decarboxylase gamma subunit